MGPHAVGLFMGDFVPVFHFLNVVSLPVHASVDPVFAFVLVFSAGRRGPAHCAEGQCGGESGGEQKSRRTLGHGCLLGNWGAITLAMATERR